MHSLIGGSHVESNLLNNLNLLEFPWPMISLLVWPSFTAESNALSTCSPVCALVSWYWELIFCATVSASETDTKLIHPLLQIQNKWDRLLYGGDRNYFMFATMQTWTCIKAVHVLYWRQNSLKDKGGGGVGWLLLGFSGGTVPPGSPKPDPTCISDQNMAFFLPSFRPGRLHI